jgi:hypothetical protein
VQEDGKPCKQRGWLGGELCFQHDPETAELRKLAGRPRKKLITVTKGQEVEGLLDETMADLRAGRVKPGQAYAVGYLAQLMLMARASRVKETKFDAKWFWEMADLMIALDKGKKSLEEKRRKAREEKKAKRMKPRIETDEPASAEASAGGHRLEGTEEDEEDHGEKGEPEEGEGDETMASAECGIDPDARRE